MDMLEGKRPFFAYADLVPYSLSEDIEIYAHEIWKERLSLVPEHLEAYYDCSDKHLQRVKPYFDQISFEMSNGNLQKIQKNKANLKIFKNVKGIREWIKFDSFPWVPFCYNRCIRRTAKKHYPSEDARSIKEWSTNMKKLSLLKPDVKTTYLNDGKGQKATYLYIPKESAGIDGLRKDVAAGATHYKALLEFAKKKPSQMVLINCTNEEEGLMAVTYLANVYNEKDGVFRKGFCDEEMTADKPFDGNISKYAEYLSGIFDTVLLDQGVVDESEDDTWTESPCRIPIIGIGQLDRYESSQFSVFQEDDMFSLGGQGHRDRKPYWLNVRTEPVCITVPENQFGGLASYSGNTLVRNLERFAENRHVYVVIVNDRIEPESCLSINGVNLYEDRTNRAMSNLCEVILEYTADLITIDSDKEEKKQYYQLLFENLVESYGCKLEKKFPKTAIVEQIVSMKLPNKAELMEKTLNYVLKSSDAPKELKGDHFAVLKLFRVLGAGVSKQEEKRSIESLEKSLVGMQNVKKQVRDIVARMKYNQKRMSLGFMKGGYHNVHLLIGAPGTAKTTVAQMMGEIMYEQRLLPGNRFISINGADLKGMYVGHSAPKTQRFFEEYDIILIDEAYSLTASSTAEGGEVDSFSQEAIAQLVIELEKHGTDKLVMFAGYGGLKVSDKDNKMKQFLKANPGIRSRINSTIYFESYTPQEMVEIVHHQAENQEYILTHDADDRIRRHFAERVGERDFGNGREARSLLENITKFAASRTMKLEEDELTKTVLQELTVEDVEAALEEQKNAYRHQKGRGKARMGFV